ncbi:amidase [Embleya sp. NBC_00896]|uniref:amidase n=1 Tax=Embleya sp. NBC_00896 TaxID=2975961 RepID=UPI002F90E258|nr:amidase [Embleya sp. NBC_00896]
MGAGNGERNGDTGGRGLGRRALLGLGVASGAGVVAAGGGGVAFATESAADADGGSGAGSASTWPAELDIAGAQARMASGALTAVALTGFYLDRIERLDKRGPTLRAVIQVNPDALRDAAALDAERRARGPRGILHGIPILLKDNLDTAGRLRTTAGSLAMLGSRPERDSTVADRLRAAGAILLGKANLSEWAGGTSWPRSGGWSAVGGQCRNPYKLDRSPNESSSGSAAATAANLCTAAIGTETDGSILSPAGANALVGLKPTVGLVGRGGLIPGTFSQDSVGPLCRTVADAAAILGRLVGVDPRDPATRDSVGHDHPDYTRFLDRDALAGARIGIPRDVYFGYSPRADAVAHQAIEVMRAAGAVIVDPADIPTARELASTDVNFIVILTEMAHGLGAYLAETPGEHPRTIAELVAFNREHADRELPYFGQEGLEILAGASGDRTDPTYLKALATMRSLAREQGIDAVLRQHRLDALVMPTGGPPGKIDLLNGDYSAGSSSQAAALAGYPAITVPAGWCSDLPVGITFVGTAWSEPTLIRLAYAYEQATLARRTPRFLPADVG